MSNAQHTPGPWAVGPWITSMGEGVYANIGAGPDRIAAVTVYGRRRDSDEHVGRKLKYGGTARSVPQEVAEANARRIVACVNACEGIPGELLTGAGAVVPGITFKGVQESADALRRELIELRAALQGLAPMWDNDGPLLTVYRLEIDAARAALKARS